MSHALPLATGEPCQSPEGPLSRILSRSKNPIYIPYPFRGSGEVRLYSKSESNTSRETYTLKQELFKKTGICKFPCFPACKKQLHLSHL